jgi:hypothetical protein
MTTATTGLLRGKTLELEEPVPEMEGKRVRVVLEALDDDVPLSLEEQREIWRQWVEHGPQGPIENDEDTELP